MKEMVSTDDSDFIRDRRAKVKEGKKTKIKCETYCKNRSKCDGYIFDSNDNSCKALMPEKVLRKGATKKEDVCLVISKFENAYCPCFNKNNLDETVHIMNNDETVTVTTDTCLFDSIEDGLYLNYKRSPYPNISGYGSSILSNSCIDGDVHRDYKDEEELNHCTSLIYNACMTFSS